MGIKHTSSGPGITTRAWDKWAMRQVAQVAQAAIVARVFTRGLDALDRAFKPYSRKPISVSATGRTARRTSLKGGRRSKSGKTIYYDGGWHELHEANTGSSKVNLTLSGETMRSFEAIAQDATTAVLAFDGEGRLIARWLEEGGRQILPLSPNDRLIVSQSLPSIIKGAMRRGRTQRGVQAQGQS